MGCAPVSPNPDAVYLQLAQLTRLSPIQTSVASLRLSPVLLTDLAAIRGFHDSLFNFDNLLLGLTKLRKTLTYYPWFMIKEIIKDMNEHPL